jgi:hypothetical protein
MIWDAHADLRFNIESHLLATNKEFGGPRAEVDRRGLDQVVGTVELDRDFKRLLRGQAPVDPRSRRILSGAMKALDSLGFVADRENGLVCNRALRISGMPDAVGKLTGNIDTIVELKVVERFRKTARAVDAMQVLYYALCRFPITEIVAGNIGMLVLYVMDTMETENTRMELILNPAPLVPLATELAAV